MLIKITVAIVTSLTEYRYYKNVADRIPAQLKMTSSCFRSDNASMKLFTRCLKNRRMLSYSLKLLLL